MELQNTENTELALGEEGSWGPRIILRKTWGPHSPLSAAQVHAGGLAHVTSRGRVGQGTRTQEPTQSTPHWLEPP